jgi:hypothetical protein
VEISYRLRSLSARSVTRRQSAMLGKIGRSLPRKAHMWIPQEICEVGVKLTRVGDAQNAVMAH